MPNARSSDGGLLLTAAFVGALACVRGHWPSISRVLMNLGIWETLGWAVDPLRAIVSSVDAYLALGCLRGSPAHAGANTEQTEL